MTRKTASISSILRLNGGCEWAPAFFEFLMWIWETLDLWVVRRVMVPNHGTGTTSFRPCRCHRCPKYKSYESSHSFPDSFIHSSQREGDTVHVWREQPQQPTKLPHMTLKLGATRSLGLYALTTINTLWWALKRLLCYRMRQLQTPFLNPDICSQHLLKNAWKAEFADENRMCGLRRNLGVSLVLLEKPLRFQHLSFKQFTFCTSLTYRGLIYTRFHLPVPVHLYVCGTEIWHLKFCALWFHRLAALTSCSHPGGGGGSILRQNQVPVQTCSWGATEEFSPRMFWWKRNNMFPVNNSNSDESRCVLLTDEQMSHRCVLQLLQNPPTPSQLIQMFCKASYC